MEMLMLILLVFVLGLRHGLDADHLACIDGLTRYNWRKGSRIARWVGTLFSFGHGLVVAVVAVILGMFTEHFRFPEYFDTIATWVSIVSLFLIGVMNTYSLLRTKSGSGGFQVHGIKAKFIPKAFQETTNPLVVVLIGGLFALAADTVSQTSVWAFAAGNAGGYMPLVVGLVFMAGIMLTDTVDSFIAYRVINQSGKMGRSASRLMGWVIAGLAFGVSLYELFTLYNPWAEIDFEIVGVFIFALLILCFAFVWRRSRSQTVMD